MRTRARLGAAVIVLLGGLLSGSGASGHGDRDFTYPPGNGSTPIYRTDGPVSVVCKPDSGSRIAQIADPQIRAENEALLGDCAFEHIQAAVDAVTQMGSRIAVLPGVYREEPSLAVTAGCEEPPEGERGMTYEWQYACPHNRNLIGVFGDDPADPDIVCDHEARCNLQIEGTGEVAADVIIDGGFKRANAVRADRADGFYLRNLTIQRVSFSGAFVAETDGYAFDRVTARWTDEYGLNTFVSDHGLFKDCEAYGNGDSGTYVGANPDLHGARPAVEITGCYVHHNALGYSGTSGNSTYAHHNTFAFNGTGIVTDSFYPDHPGAPEDSAVFTHNQIYSNNTDYYRFKRDGTCDRPSEERGYEDGVVCPIVPVPVGTGMMIAGGNANVLANNNVYDNWRYGFMQFWVPAALRGETDPAMQYDTSHFNRYLQNRFGEGPDGADLPNGLDIWWDEEGAGNCFEGNTDLRGPASSDPATLPLCGGTPLFTPGNPVKQARLVPCAQYLDPPCDWFHQPPRPT